MSEPGELQVRFGGQLMVLSPDERLGFGRLNTDPSTPRGWGYEGRFVDLSASAHVHRLWGEVVCEHGIWIVRSLGSLHPIRVVLDRQRAIELAPFEEGQEPDSYAATAATFRIELSVGTERFDIDCTVGSTGSGSRVDRPATGANTTTLCDEMASCVTATEFVILAAMAREYRSAGGTATPQPVSYARIMHAQEVTKKQAVSAVARVVTRLRDRDLMPDEVSADQQRAWLCQQFVAHRVFEELERRYRPES